MSEDQLQPQDTLDDHGVDDVLDEGITPPDQPQGVTAKGVTDREQLEGETIDDRSARRCRTPRPSGLGGDTEPLEMDATLDDEPSPHHRPDSRAPVSSPGTGARLLPFAGGPYRGGVSFDVSADAYARFMGRWADPLAVVFAAYAGVRAGQRALDVGCGPGALTALLVERLGAEAVSAVDPSASFVAATRARLPGVDVRTGVAEDLPYDDDSVDVALAQLVVHFMADPVAGLTEMRRVTRPGGVVAATVWDHAGLSGPLATFWQAVRELDPAAPGEADLPGTRDGTPRRAGRRGGMAARRGHPARRSRSTSRRTTTGGRRTRSGSARPGPTSPGWTTHTGPRCASAARRCCPRRRSRCPPPHGPSAPGPDGGP